jgi:hypothetical protein
MLTTLTKNNKMEKLLEIYKNHKIVETDGVIEVICERNTRFVIGLDDTKDSGSRKFNEDCNNIKAAKDYIDWKSKFTK